MRSIGVPVLPDAEVGDYPLGRGGRGRLPAAGQGRRRRRRQGHAPGRATPTTWPTRSPRRSARRPARSATTACSSSGSSTPAAPRRGADPRRRARHGRAPRRARVLGAAPPPEDHRGVALPGGRRRRCASGMTDGGGDAPRASSATATPARSSSCSAATASSSSWRSTPGCRSSIRSPSWPGGCATAHRWTSSGCSCWSRRASRCRSRRTTWCRPATPIEARVYAEDVAAGFLPATGTLRALVDPGGARRPRRRRRAARLARSASTTTRCSPRSSPPAPTRDEAVALLARGAARQPDRTVSRRTATSCVRALAAPRVPRRATTTPASSRSTSTPRPPAAVTTPSTGSTPPPPRSHMARRHHLAAPLPTLPPGWRNSRSQPHRADVPAAGRRAGGRVSPPPRRRLGRRGGRRSCRRAGPRLARRARRRGDRPRLARPPASGSRSSSPATIVDVDSPLGHSPFVRRAPLPRRRRRGCRRRAAGTDAGLGGLASTPRSAVRWPRGDLLVILEAMKMEHRVTAPHDGLRRRGPRRRRRPCQHRRRACRFARN